MTAENIFSICNTLAMIGWIILAFLPMWKLRERYVTAIIVLLLAGVYTWLIVSAFSPTMFSNFSTLDGVAKLFADKQLLLAGWVHYLAFDLFVGCYIVRSAKLNGINHWLTVPILLLTFMLGPIGFLVFYVVRWVRTRKYVIDNL